ncbi:hypothetical protein C8F01DRAFT_1374038 [Mycena amicta]|nr:hypothetical protein C8F01DRAFT_1374038 [Mycena amicta]
MSTATSTTAPKAAAGKASNKALGGAPKPRRSATGAAAAAAAAQEARVAALEAALAAANKTIAEQNARAPAGGELDTTNENESIKSLVRPAGEAGSNRRGFNLQAAMGLIDDRKLYKDIQRHIRNNCKRVNIDGSIEFARQDVEKLGMIYKLGRKEFPYLTNKRFALDWAQADLVKQYLRNYRKVEVKAQRMPNRQERKRQREEGASAGPSKRARVATAGNDEPSDVDGDD